MPFLFDFSPRPLAFQASHICRSRCGPLPHYVFRPGKGVVSFTELFQQFFNYKWEPILVAQGIEPEDFKKLFDKDENYGLSFCYEYDLEKLMYFIVDADSKLHENGSEKILMSLSISLKKNFEFSSSIFEFYSSPGIPIGSKTEEYKIPDASIWVSEHFADQNFKKERIPFLVIETAVRQPTKSLEARTEFWKKKKIPYIITMDRNRTSEYYEFTLIEKGSTIFSEGLTCEHFPNYLCCLSKAIIKEELDIERFDKYPENSHVRFG